jgi:Predicted NADH:ubiquinone oxidoreductase, subunit RnfD
MMEVSISPHIRSDLTIRRIMIYVIIALIPCSIAGVYYFGYYTLAITTVSVVSALITEFIGLKMMKRKFEMDGSAIVTGLMLALILPPTVPVWVPAVGAAFAIAFSNSYSVVWGITYSIPLLLAGLF